MDTSVNPQSRNRRQLSLFVEQDRRLVGSGGAPVSLGTVKMKGDLRVRANLQPGDDLYVQVTNADGEVIAAGTYEVDGVTFKPMKLEGEVFGIERVHNLLLENGDALAQSAEE